MSQRRVPMTEAVYDRTTIALHWLTAASVLVLWIIGQTADWIPDGPANTAVWSVHVVLGFGLAAILAWRLVWRASGGRHLPPADSGALQVLGKLTHYLLYALLLVVVVLGVVNAFVRGYNLFDLASLPQLGDRAWRRPITHWHGLAANVLLGLALFHAAAALVHHYLWHDAVLKRMVPGRNWRKPIRESVLRSEREEIETDPLAAFPGRLVQCTIEPVLFPIVFGALIVQAQSAGNGAHVCVIGTSFHLRRHSSLVAPLALRDGQGPIWSTASRATDLSEKVAL